MNVIVPTGVEHDVFRKPLRTSSHRVVVTPQPMLRIAATVSFAALIATSLIAFATPVHAQIGNIFSDRPRPPANIQRGEPIQEPEEEEVPDLPPQGRLLPTTSVDQFGATLASWFGVTATELPTVFPNIGNFASRNVGFV